MGGKALNAGSVDQFTIRCVAVADDDDLNTFVVGLAEDADGSGWGLVFQIAHSFDEQDRMLGEDTYCISTTWGATVYGGLTSCVLQDDELVLEFDSEGADTLGISEECHLQLQVDRDAILQLRQGLSRVFSSGSSRPDRLHL
jgi:Immunity protein 10